MIDMDFVFGRTPNIYNLPKLARPHKVQNSKMCKIDGQALSYVEELSETHL